MRPPRSRRRHCSWCWEHATGGRDNAAHFICCSSACGRLPGVPACCRRRRRRATADRCGRCQPLPSPWLCLRSLACPLVRVQKKSTNSSSGVRAAPAGLSSVCTSPGETQQDETARPSALPRCASAVTGIESTRTTQLGQLKARCVPMCSSTPYVCLSERTVAPQELRCRSSRCTCRAFAYLPSAGAWNAKCACKHSAVRLKPYRVRSRAHPLSPSAPSNRCCMMLRLRPAHDARHASRSMPHSPADVAHCGRSIVQSWKHGSSVKLRGGKWTMSLAAASGMPR